MLIVPILQACETSQTVTSESIEIVLSEWEADSPSFRSCFEMAAFVIASQMQAVVDS